MSEPDWLAANRANWDERVPLHLRAPMYDLSALRAGRGRLDPITEAELGPVAGRRVLHLQCHFGQDTLTLAQRGADATGLDFSAPAIAAARGLAAELGLGALFVASPACTRPATACSPGRTGPGYLCPFLSRPGGARLVLCNLGFTPGLYKHKKKREAVMSIIGWIAFGLACGFLISRLVRVRGEDVLLDVALGAAGAVMGGWTFVRLCAVALHGINVPSLGVAAGGALLVPLAYHAVFGRRAAE